MFACNKIPKIKNDIDDNAFWDRWMILDFTNVFASTDKDTNFNKLSDISNDNEMSGLLNWAIEGLVRLRKNGHFAYKRDWQTNKNIMQGESNNIAKFVYECCSYKGDVWIANIELYDKYEEFCNLNDITKETEQKFFKDIRKCCNFAKFGIKNDNNKWGVKGLKIKDIIPVLDITI